MESNGEPLPGTAGELLLAYGVQLNKERPRGWGEGKMLLLYFTAFIATLLFLGQCFRQGPLLPPEPFRACWQGLCSGIPPVLLQLTSNNTHSISGTAGTALLPCCPCSAPLLLHTAALVSLTCQELLPGKSQMGQS